MKLFFELCFDGFAEASLLETHFRSPLSGTVFLSTRGKSPARRASGSFEWSAAVRSMALLFIRSKQCDNAKVEGELARPLDYALSKKPIWLKEMFGIIHNESMLRRLFIRSNPEGKRAGTIAVSLNTEFWSSDKIAVKHCGDLVKRPEMLKMLENRLISQLQDNWGTPLNLLRGGLEHELRINMQNNDILGSAAVKLYAQKLSQSCLPDKLNARSLLSSLAEYKAPDPSGSTRKDLIKYLNNSLPLSAEVPAAVSMAAAIFLRLKDAGVCLDFNSHYSAAFHLAKAVLEGKSTSRPDVLVLGVVPGMHFIGQADRHEYEFLMPIGYGSSWVIEGKNREFGSACYFKEEPMKSMLAVEKLEIKRTWHKSNAEILQEVCNDELSEQAIVIAPFGWIAGKLGRAAHCLNIPGSDGLMFMLFVRKELRRDPRILALELLIHRIESDLIFDQHAVGKASRALMNETDICFHLLNEGGLTNLRTLAA